MVVDVQIRQPKQGFCLNKAVHLDTLPPVRIATPSQKSTRCGSHPASVLRKQPQRHQQQAQEPQQQQQQQQQSVGLGAGLSGVNCVDAPCGLSPAVREPSGARAGHRRTPRRELLPPRVPLSARGTSVPTTAAAGSAVYPPALTKPEAASCGRHVVGAGAALAGTSPAVNAALGFRWERVARRRQPASTGDQTPDSSSPDHVDFAHRRFPAASSRSSTPVDVAACVAHTACCASPAASRPAWMALPRDVRDAHGDPNIGISSGAGACQGVDCRSVDAAKKCAEAAAARAMKIRALVAPTEYSWWAEDLDLPVLLSRSTTAASNYRSSPSTPGAAASRLSTTMVSPCSELAQLPAELVITIGLCLPAAEIACLVMACEALAEARESVVAVVLCRAMPEGELLPGLRELPATRSLCFMHSQAAAALHARSRQVAAGLQHSVVVRNGRAYHWSATDSGPLIRGSAVERQLPSFSQIALAEPVAMVACGGDHSVLLTSSGAAWSFGRNSEGQLGTGGNKDSPRPIRMGAVCAAAQVACGSDHTLVLGVDGCVWACGRSSEGQLGIVHQEGAAATSPECVLLLQKVRSLFAGIHLVACGADHSLAVSRSGAVFGFGENSKGQLGLGHLSNQCRPLARAPARTAPHASRPACRERRVRRRPLHRFGR